MSQALRWIVLGALFLIPFLPLYVDSSLFFPFISSKGFAFRILVEIAVAGWAVLALMDKRYRPRFSWTLLIYAALTLWMFVADLFAINPDKAFWSNFERMDGWVMLIHVFLFFVVAGAVLSAEKRWRAWWLAVLAVSALVSVHGLWQIWGFAEIHQGGVRVDANVGNAAYLAAYLLFTIAVALWQGLAAKGWLRYALFALAAVQLVILFATATRGALLGFVAAAALSAFLFALEAGKKGRTVAVGLLVAILALGAGFLLVKDTPFVREDPTLSRLASITPADGEVRFTLWGMALEGVAERPLTGWGHEGFMYIFAEKFRPSLYGQEPWFDRAHSVYMDWLVSGGVPALLLFLALLVSAVVALYRSGVPRAERVLLIAALAAYAFQALFVFDNLLTYVLLAALLAMAHDASKRTLRRLEALPELRESATASVALPIVCVILAGTLWVVNANNIMAGKALIRAVASQDPRAALSEFDAALGSGSFVASEAREQLVAFASRVAAQASLPEELREEATERAVAAMAEQVAALPRDTRSLMQYARALEAAGDQDEALAALTRALELSPNRQILLLQKGLLLLRAGAYPEAGAAFDAAYALGGHDDTAAYAAAARILSGDRQGARTLLLERFGTTTVDHDALRYAYFETRQYGELVASFALRAERRPEDAGAQLDYVRALAAAGRPEDARAAARAFIEAFPQHASEGEAILRALDAR